MITEATAILAAAAAFIPTAETHWGQPTPCGTPRVVAIETEYQGEAYPEGCAIGVNTRYAWTSQQLCVLVAHEDGHLQGREHFAYSLMDPNTMYHYPPAGCPPEEFVVRNRINRLRDSLNSIKDHGHRASIRRRLARQRAVLAELMGWETRLIP